MQQDLVAVILAGGQSSRLQGMDKAFARLWDKPLIEHTLDRLHDRVANVAISVDGDAERYSTYELSSIVNAEMKRKSLLVEILGAIEFFREQRPDAAYLLCVPVDVPVFPESIIEPLKNRARQSENGLAYVEVDGQPQPLFCIWSLAILDQLKAVIASGEKDVMRTLIHLKADTLTYVASNELEFARIDSPGQLEEMERMLNS